jgi:hypothetical protein
MIVTARQTLVPGRISEQKVPCRLYLQVWDNDLIRNDFLGKNKHHSVYVSCVFQSVKFVFFIFLTSFSPPLWSCGQSSWLQIRRPGFDSRYYQGKKVVGLERGALSLVSTIEELLDRKVAAPV